MEIKIGNMNVVLHVEGRWSNTLCMLNSEVPRLRFKPT